MDVLEDTASVSAFGDGISSVKLFFVFFFDEACVFEHRQTLVETSCLSETQFWGVDSVSQSENWCDLNVRKFP